MAELNWGILNTPNVFATGLEGFQAGQQAALQRQKQVLLQRQAQREEEQYQADLKRQQRRQEITAGYSANPVQARQEAVGSGDFDLAEQFAKLDATKREEIGRKAEIGAKIAQQLLGEYPGEEMTEQRKAAAIAMAPQLTQYGVTPEEVAASDYTTGGLQRSLALGMTINEAIAKANADRDFGLRKSDTEHDNTLADQQFGETKRHNQVGESISRGHLGVSQANLGLSRERLNLDRDKATREAGPAKLTEGQAKDGFNASRMRGAAGVIARLEGDRSFNPTLAGAGAAVGGSKSRQYGAAKLEWADSLLRSTSGAQATKEEIENTARTYFPQVGDSPDVVRQKAQRRREVQTDLARRAGPGAPPATSGQGPVRVSTPDEARALPPGTRFITPDGREKVR